MISTPISDPSEPPTLEAVKALFDQWRTMRSKRSKIPECLWSEVRRLSKRYSYSQISSQLRINYQQLFSHLADWTEEQEGPDNRLDPFQSHFVKAHIPLVESSQQPQWLPPSSPAILEIQGKDGINLKATGLHPQDLIPLLETFLNRSSD